MWICQQTSKYQDVGQKVAISVLQNNSVTYESVVK